MPSFNVKSFTLDPAEILGKLHFAAETHVKDKFGKNIEVVNTLIDTSDPNKPKAVLKNGTYTLKITLNNDDFKNDKKKIVEPVVEYLTWFAGKDAAEQMQKRGGNMFQRFLMKLGAYKSKRSDIEKSKTVDKNNNTTTFTFDYSVTIHQGSQQNESIVNSHEKFNLCLEFDFIDVPLVFEAYSQYDLISRQILKESMKKKSEKLVNELSKKNYVKAEKTLESLIREKINARVEDVLSQSK